MSRESEICAALKSLGVHGKVRIGSGCNRVRVYVDGRYFGTFDFERKTFVD